MFAVNRSVTDDVVLDIDLRAFAGFRLQEHIVLENSDMRPSTPPSSRPSRQRPSRTAPLMRGETLRAKTREDLLERPAVCKIRQISARSKIFSERERFRAAQSYCL